MAVGHAFRSGRKTIFHWTKASKQLHSIKLGTLCILQSLACAYHAVNKNCKCALHLTRICSKWWQLACFFSHQPRTCHKWNKYGNCLCSQSAEQQKLWNVKGIVLIKETHFDHRITRWQNEWHWRQQHVLILGWWRCHPMMLLLQTLNDDDVIVSSNDAFALKGVGCSDERWQEMDWEQQQQQQQQHAWAGATFVWWIRIARWKIKKSVRLERWKIKISVHICEFPHWSHCDDIVGCGNPRESETWGR